MAISVAHIANTAGRTTVPIKKKNQWARITDLRAVRLVNAAFAGDEITMSTDGAFRVHGFVECLGRSKIKHAEIECGIGISGLPAYPTTSSTGSVPTKFTDNIPIITTICVPTGKKVQLYIRNKSSADDITYGKLHVVISPSRSPVGGTTISKCRVTNIGGFSPIFAFTSGFVFVIPITSTDVLLGFAMPQPSLDYTVFGITAEGRMSIWLKSTTLLGIRTDHNARITDHSFELAIFN